jgi:acyltransferase
MKASTPSRLAYIDWMRGLACVLMFQTHCYDAWLSPAARYKSTFYMWSQLGGTLPAPLFLFLAGISFALVTDKLRKKDVPAAQIAAKTIRRGAEILALGLLFRFQEFLIAWGWSPWSDLLRVDILNTIGVSMMLMGAMCWIVFSRLRGPRIRVTLGAASVGVALIISFLTPLVWTTWRPRGLPWPIESYFDGVHNFGQPQSWLFPIFPWVGFAFAGLAVGFLLLSDWARSQEVRIFLLAGVGGMGLIYLDVISWQPFGAYNFWLTSPNFFLMRVGMLLAIMSATYVWCRWGAGQWGFSPLIQLGQTSLLVYWVHFDFVYGRLSILPKRVDDVRTASIGLLTIFLAMLLLSVLRTRYKKSRQENAALVRTPATSA